MKHSTICVPRLVGLAALALLLATVGRAGADVILLSPVDARGIRQFPGTPPFLLNFLSINGSVEDRTVIQFDLTALGGSLPGPAALDLPLRNLDPGGPVGVIDLYTFAGTRTVTPAQFNAGTLFSSFSNNASGVEHVDVTAAVQQAVDAGQQFVGFRLSTATADRYLLGPPFTPAGPTLTVVPEPTTLALAAVVTCGGLLYGWRRRRAA